MPHDDVVYAAVLAEKFANLMREVDNLAKSSRSLGMQLADKLGTVSNMDLSMREVKKRVDDLEHEFHQYQIKSEQRITSMETSWKHWTAIIGAISAVVGAVVASKF